MTKKILIVDDDPELVQFLELVFRQDGYRVAGASNGWEGLQEALVFRPDLVLLDVMMPGLDGWDTLSRLRGLSDVPVIMLSALSGRENMVRALNNGADDYISKPFKVSELKARVRAILRRESFNTTQAPRTPHFNASMLVLDPSIRQLAVGGVGQYVSRN